MVALILKMYIIFESNCARLGVLSGNEELSCSCATIEHLCLRSTAADKIIRHRACQWINAILDEMEEIEDKLTITMMQKLLPRLRDKIVLVRMWAVKAISKLAILDQGPVITKELLRLLETDSSKDIRIAVLENCYLDGITLPHIIERVKDAHPDVRSATYRLLQERVKITKLRVGQRALILQYGLNDRNDEVRGAATALVLTWLQQYDYDVPRVLSLLGLERYETEAELLALRLLEIADSDDKSSDFLKRMVWESRPCWGAGLESLSAADILWAQLRGEYASKCFSSLTSADLLEMLLPAPNTLCELLLSAKSDTLAESAQQQLMVRYLLRITPLVAQDITSRNTALEEVCLAYIKDVNSPALVMESVLNVWAIALACPESELKDSSMAIACQLMEPVDAGNESAMLGRVMQLFTWYMQRGEGGRKISSCSDFLPNVLQSLSTPVVGLRVLGVRCLGLICLSSEEICASHREILLQVARTDAEDLEIRSQALQALVDVSAVYCELYRDNQDLTGLLLRVLVADDEPMLLRQAAEGAARLLFSGSLTEPRLFAQLTKVFFQPRLVPGALEGEGENLQNEIFLGSPARLQQILHVFFRSFFIAGNGRVEIALAATAELVADVSALIRHEDVEECALQRVLKIF